MGGMTLAILYYSSSGNNRLLARHLAARLGAQSEEIRDTRWFRKLRLINDMARDRRPPIAPIALDAGDYDHVLFVSPLYDSNIGFPMKTALSTWGRQVRAYSFASFCGYHRQEQRDKIVAQLTDLTGRAPAHVSELCVGDLVPEKDRRNVWVVSRYRVKEPELARFSDRLDEIAGWFPA